MSDFGGKLRLERERRGISLRQISASTKISIAVLEALERNDISKLPGGIFSRAFVRAYAAEVGLDPARTVEEFLERFEAEPAPSPSAEPRPSIPEEESSFESQQRIVRVAVMLVAISVPLIGLVLYFTVRGARSNVQATPVQRSEVAAPPPVTESPVVETPAAAAAPAAPNASPGAAATTTIRLELHPTGDCWVRLAVDGRPGVSRLMHAGDRQIVEVRESAIVDVGDAGVFAYSINGRPGKPLGAAGEVRTARITRQTLSQYTQ